MFEDLVPIVAIAFVFGIPIVAIFGHHQRRMAEILNQRAHLQAGASAQEVAALRQEVAELRQVVIQQAIELDSIKSLAAPTQQRLNS